MAAASPSLKNRSAQQNVEQGMFGNLIAIVGKALVFSLMTLFFAILMEWIGMQWFWEAQGESHSAIMLQNELSYLNNDFKRSVLVSEPLQFAQRFAANMHLYLVEKTGLDRFIRWLVTPDPNYFIPGWRQTLHEGLRILAPYLLAAITIVQVYAVRVAVLCLSLPAFGLFALIALIDGLVLRDIRRWSGGRESAFVYHWAKKLIWPSVFLPWAIYLALPVSLHPNLIVLPFALVFSGAIRVMSATFKKYL